MIGNPIKLIVSRRGAGRITRNPLACSTFAMSF